MYGLFFRLHYLGLLGLSLSVYKHAGPYILVGRDYVDAEIKQWIT